MRSSISPIYLLAVFLLVVYACASTAKVGSSDREKPYTGEFYFPMKEEADERHTNDKLDSFSNKWYSKHLNSLEEPVLFTRKDSVSIFRYTNLGTWDTPFTYRIELKDSSVTITYKRTDGQGGYRTGKVTANETKRLGVQYWDSLTVKLKSIAFWESNTYDEIMGFDGARWILEGYHNGQYHFLDRWSPDHYGDPKFVEVCNYFEQLFGSISK